MEVIMGVLSTMDITRYDAVNEIKERLDFKSLTNHQLCDILELLTSEKNLYNFSIVDVYEETERHYTEGCLI